MLSYLLKCSEPVGFWQRQLTKDFLGKGVGTLGFQKRMCFSGLYRKSRPVFLRDLNNKNSLANCFNGLGSLG